MTVAIQGVPDQKTREKVEPGGAKKTTSSTRIGVLTTGVFSGREGKRGWKEGGERLVFPQLRAGERKDCLTAIGGESPCPGLERSYLDGYRGGTI